jgi:Ethanolamine utilization protein EutJ (predicted chaperonin)
VSDFIVGIDLGTTFSAIAYVDDNGVPHIIPTYCFEPRDMVESQAFNKAIF